MTHEPTVTVEHHGEAVRVLVMDNTAGRNKLAEALVARLRQEIDAFKADGAARVLVLTGVGNVFCAGADLKFLAKQSSAGAREYLRGIIELFNSLDDLDKPTIAAVNGAALGGGMEMSMACDFRLMAHTAVMGLPESKLGILAGAGGMQRLPHFVGRGRALQITLSGTPISSHQALEMGLVSEIWPRQDLLAKAIALGTMLSSLSGPALSQIKRLVRLAATASRAEMDDAALDAMVACFETPEFQEGVSAFMAKTGVFRSLR